MSMLITISTAHDEMVYSKNYTLIEVCFAAVAFVPNQIFWRCGTLCKEEKKNNHKKSFYFRY